MLRTARLRSVPPLYQRQFACAPQARASEDPSTERNADEIMNMTANKATRFVYLRTLPLLKQPELEGQVDEIADKIVKQTQTICQKNITTIVDDRAAVHLHTAALAVATHRVISPQIRNEIRLNNMIRAGFGAQLLVDPSVSEQKQDTSANKRPDFWIVRAALWFSFNRMAAIRKMTTNMARDFGAAFITEPKDDNGDGKSRHTLSVSKFFQRFWTRTSESVC